MHFRHLYATTPLFRLSLSDSGRGGLLTPMTPPPGSAPALVLSNFTEFKSIDQLVNTALFMCAKFPSLNYSQDLFNIMYDYI